MAKVFFLFFFICSFSLNVTAQSKTKINLKHSVTPKLDPNAPLKLELNYGFNLLNDGWAISLQRLEYAPEKGGRKFSGFFMDIGELRSLKEKSVLSKLANADTTGKGPLSYKYGKIYNNYQIKIGYIGRISISGKLDPNNIRIHYFYGGAVLSSLFKPYILKLARADSSGGIIVTEESFKIDNAAQFLNPQYIIGSAGISKGWNKLTYGFGIVARTGFQFDFSPTKNRCILIEFGTEIKSSFGTEKSTMAYGTVGTVTPNVYIGAKLGKRYF
jgi:hypothetical protein